MTKKSRCSALFFVFLVRLLTHQTIQGQQNKNLKICLFSLVLILLKEKRNSKISRSHKSCKMSHFWHPLIAFLWSFEISWTIKEVSSLVFVNFSFVLFCLLLTFNIHLLLAMSQWEDLVLSSQFWTLHFDLFYIFLWIEIAKTRIRNFTIFSGMIQAFSVQEMSWM